MLDEIKFVSRGSLVEDYRVLDIYLNGASLKSLIREQEVKFLADFGMAFPGVYEGIPSMYGFLPKEHFWGMADPAYQKEPGRVAILENGRSGIPGELTISVEIEVDGETVRWRGFRQEQVGMTFKHIRPFVFDLADYMHALKEAEEA
ncbi:MAG: hypothetical protein AAFR61_21580 [Bacteroidota bacterium]